jgi:hypothetical protein
MAPSLPVVASVHLSQVLRGFARGSWTCLLVLGLLSATTAHAEEPSAAAGEEAPRGVLFGASEEEVSRTQVTPESRFNRELLGGAVGSLMVIPGFLLGLEVGSSAGSSDLGCTHGEGLCSTYLGIGIGAMSGAALGASLGVSIAGHANGGYGSFLITLGGAAAGSLVALPFIFSDTSQFWSIVAAPIGAVAGALLAYELSDTALRPSTPITRRASKVEAAPTVALLPGGGLVGLVGRF